MKKLMTMIGIAGMLCLSPSCKKSVAQPEVLQPEETASSENFSKMLSRDTSQENTATLYVLLDSKPCSTPQPQYTSASVDIRSIKVFNTEYGWEDLTPVPGAWDVVSLQQASVPVADITEQSTVHAGRITKIALTLGDNIQLVVNDTLASCYKVIPKHIVLDLDEEITADTLNEIVVSIDICGNIKIEYENNTTPCYILKPEMAFQSITVR